MPELSNQDWLDYLGTPKKRAVDPYLALGKAGLDNPTPDLLSSLASPPTHPGGPLSQADLDFLPKRQEPPGAPMSIGGLPPLPPPPGNAATGQPGAFKAIPGDDSAPRPATAEEIARVQAMPDRTAEGEALAESGWGQAQDAPNKPGVPVTNPMLFDDMEARVARQKSGQNASLPPEQEEALAETPPQISVPREVGGQPTMPGVTEEGPQGYDPIKLLQSQYGDKIKALASAREHDLNEQEMQKYLMLASSGAQHAGGNAGAAAALGQEAAKLQAAPLRMNSLQKQAEVESLQSKSAQEQLITTKQAWEVMPDSPISKDARMAFVSSPEFDTVAAKVAEANGISIMDAKKELYKRSKGMTKLGMDTFMAQMKMAGDYSLQRVQEANTSAEEAQRKALTKQLEQETSQKAKVYEAMNNKDSAGSVIAKQNILRSYGASVATIYEQQTGKKWADATLMDIANYDPQLAAHGLQVIQFQVETERANEAKKYVSPEIEVRAVPGAGPEGSTLGQIRNYVETTPQERAEYAQDVQAAREGYRYGLQAQHYLSTGKPKGAKDVIFQTGDGGRLVNALQKLKAYSGRLAPATRDALQAATTALGDGITVRNSVFNSAKAVVDQAVMELGGNLQARSAKFVPSDSYLKSFESGPPSVPPVMLQHEVFQENIKGRNMRGIRFNQIGPAKNVKYYINPETGQWFDPKVEG